MAKDKSIPSNLVFTREKFKYDTIEDMRNDVALKIGDVVELNGYYEAGDGADHKRKIEAQDDGSGVMIKNVNDMAVELTLNKSEPELYRVGLYANIVHNGEVNVSWFGCKKNDESVAVKNSELINNQLKNKNTHLFFPKGTWSFNQIKFNSFCSLIGEDRNLTILKQTENINDIGEDYNKNYAFLQANEYGENNNFKGVQRVTIKELTIQGIKQDGICGIKFLGLLNNKNNISDFNDCHNLIERVWISEFDTGLSIGKFYKEYRILNCVSRWNLKDGMYLWGSDCFVSNCTCYSNDNNGYTVDASETRVVFSKAFYNKNAGFEIKDQGTYNSISSQENFEYGILISCSEQPILIHGFLGSNGISGGSPSEIKPNSSAIKVLGNYNKIRIDVFTSDFRSYNEKKPTSYSNYFIDLVGEGNSIQANVISQVKFNEIINLRYNHIKTFYYNASDLVSEYRINQFDYNGIYELGNIFIKKVTGTRFSGVFGRCDISSPSSKDKNFNFEYRISKDENNDVLFEIKRGVLPTSIKNFKLFYKIDENDNLHGKLCVENNGYDYPNFKFINLGYTASMWIACDSYRRTFTNDGTWVEKDANFVFQVETLLNTPYMSTKMQQEGVYNDFIMYMDEKTAYDKQQRKLEQDRQFAYEEALKENPNLTYEEFMSVQPMTLNLVEEPQPSENLKKFMEKYL